MFGVLLKKQLLELFQGYFMNRKNGKARSGKSTVGLFGLFALLFLFLGFAIYGMASGIGVVTLGGEINWIFFAVMSLLAIMLGVFGSVFNTYAALYLPKDNELLLSMPIPTNTLLAVRLAGVYITSLMYSALVWIPTMIAYWIIVPTTLTNVLFPILLTFVIALFVAVLSCILGWIVALIATKAKGKSFITVILSLGVIALYYVVYFKIVNSIGEILNSISEIGEKVKSWLYYVYLLGNAADGQVLPMLASVGITVLLAVICFVFISKTFMKFALGNVTAAKETKGKEDFAVKTVEKALFEREMKHFASLPTWMLNGGLGLVIMPVIAVVLIIKSVSIGNVIAQISANAPNVLSALPVIVTALVCLITAMDCVVPVSVSIEGQTLWQIRSLPIDSWMILRKKMEMFICLSVLPSLILAVTFGVILGFGAIEIVLVCLAILAFIVLDAEFGLFLNLKDTKLNWTNPAMLTKQSIPVVINLFGGWAFSALVGVGGFFLAGYIGTVAALAAIIVLFALLALILRDWLKNKGTKIFENL